MEAGVIVKDFSIEPFASLRTTPWEPNFTWVDSQWGAAELINSWHENGAEHIGKTFIAILDLKRVGEWTGLAITESIIKRTHTEIFPGEKWTGKWRDVRVTVGPHRPPGPGEVSEWMSVLRDDLSMRRYNNPERSLNRLLNWYYAFETIHPFQDGNGRVGGAIVSAYSHLICPEKGYLAACQ